MEIDPSHFNINELFISGSEPTKRGTCLLFHLFLININSQICLF